MKALIVVDVQKDFCEGGALAVEGGNAVALRIASHAFNNRNLYAEVVYTKDWHNPLPDTNDGHFDEWPVHCVQGTPGAEFHSAILNYDTARVFYKGMGSHGYSGFGGTNHCGWDEDETLEEYLRFRRVDEVDVVGIAGDFCVRATALDAKELGFKVRVIPELVVSVGGDEATAETVRMVKE